MRNRRNAFTLVELLVVIGIVVMLLGLLLPVISSARGSARSVQCASNLRQIMLGTMQFSDASGGLLPPHKQSGVVTVSIGDGVDSVELDGARWPTLLAPYLENTFNLDQWRELSAIVGKTDDQFVPIDNGVFLCPDAPERTTVRNLGYGYNYQFLGNRRAKHSDDDSGDDPLPGAEFARYPVGLTGVAMPSRTVAFADSLGSSGELPTVERLPYSGQERLIDSLGNHGYTLDPPRSYTEDGVDFSNAHYGPAECTSSTRMCPVDPRHGGSVNVVFLDGHTASMTPKALGYSVNTNGSFNRNGLTNQWFSGVGADINPAPCDPDRN